MVARSSSGVGARLMAKCVHLPEDSVIVALGVGLGHDIIALCLQGYRVVGVDRDPFAIWVASHNLACLDLLDKCFLLQEG